MGFDVSSSLGKKYKESHAYGSFSINAALTDGERYIGSGRKI